MNALFKIDEQQNKIHSDDVTIPLFFTESYVTVKRALEKRDQMENTTSTPIKIKNYRQQTSISIGLKYLVTGSFYEYIVRQRLILTLLYLLLYLRSE